MMRLACFSAIGVFLAFQLLLLSGFSFVSYMIRNDPKDFPRMSLPVATHFKRCHYDCVISEDISWTPKGGWIVAGKGPIKDGDIDRFLSEIVERSNSEGLVPKLRIRIPADASPRVFVGLTKRMERAGVSQFYVAVVEKRSL